MTSHVVLTLYSLYKNRSANPKETTPLAPTKKTETVCITLVATIVQRWATSPMNVLLLALFVKRHLTPNICVKTPWVDDGRKNYDVEKRALSLSATPQPMNKKSILEYIIDPNGPCFPFTLLPKKSNQITGPIPWARGHTISFKFPPPKQSQASSPALHRNTDYTVAPERNDSFMVSPSTPSVVKPITSQLLKS
ncbi:hypothetical protein DSO57_1008285 [Entomophthora muscae]|uniref:Uncharacterized protein n=1 Tax=Entomophthora muscae TaxID=34485 RepID=A0ACC2USE5_9FUNG|nr:hypothetical protein DSO57_1008285 [Entomophthora muscae]